MASALFWQVRSPQHPACIPALPYDSFHPVASYSRSLTGFACIVYRCICLPAEHHARIAAARHPPTRVPPLDLNPQSH